MDTQIIETIVARQVTIPVCSNGLELYRLLKVNPQYETVVLCNMFSEHPRRIPITPDTKPIVISEVSNWSGSSQFYIIIVKNEKVYDLFVFPSKSIN